MSLQPAREIDSAVVYKAVNLVNGHSYIGFTTQGLARREWQHRKDARCKKGGFRFHAAMRKYGQENFVFDLMADFAGDDELAKLYEREAIAKYKPEYNLSYGGDGGRLSEETRAKISAAHMGRVGTHLGKKFSEEHKKRIGDAQRGKPKPSLLGRRKSDEARKKTSASLMGHPGWNKGGTVSEETRQKISVANKGQVPWILGMSHTDESKAKMSAARKRYYENPKPGHMDKLRLAAANMVEKQKRAVQCVNDGKVFSSGSEAERFYGLGKARVTQVITGKLTHVKGLVFIRHEAKE